MSDSHSYIRQMQIDQKSMGPSQKKKELKNRVTDFNAKYHQLDIKLSHLKSLVVVFEDDYDHEEEQQLNDDDLENKGMLKKSNKKRLDSAEEAIHGQNSML